MRDRPTTWPASPSACRCWGLQGQFAGSGSAREPGEGGDEGVVPGPVVNSKVESSAAADEPGGNVQQPVSGAVSFGGGEGSVEEQHRRVQASGSQASPTSSTQTVLMFSCRTTN